MHRIPGYTFLSFLDALTARGPVITLMVAVAAPLAVMPVAAQDVTVTGQVRPRYEFRDPVAGEPDDFVSMRTRLSVRSERDSGLTLFAQVQDVRLFGEEGHPLFDYSADALDLHQGYLRFQGRRATWLTTTIGRMESPLGGERLVGAVGWAQQGQSFDGVRFDIETDRTHWSVSGFIVGDDSAPVGGEEEDLLSIYGTIKDVGPGRLEVYWINDRISAASESDEHLIGSRYVFGGSIFGRAEATIARGTRADSDVSAYMFGARAGTMLADGQLSATLWYDYLSGDDPGTSEVEVFNTLFATNHKFYGFADLFLNIPTHTGGAGLQDLAVKLLYRPASDLSIGLDLHSFRAAEGAGLTDRHFGEEVDLTVTRPYMENLTATVGLSRVFHANGLTEIGRLSEDMTWFYVMLNATF